MGDTVNLVNRKSIKVGESTCQPLCPDFDSKLCNNYTKRDCYLSPLLCRDLLSTLFFPHKETNTSYLIDLI